MDRRFVTCLAIAAGALGLVSAAGATVGSSAAARSRDNPVRTAKAAKRCKRGQVRLRTGRRVSCRPVRRVLPVATAGDPRLALAQAGLGADWSRLRNRRGQPARSLPRLLRKLGPHTSQLLRNLTVRGITRLDALAMGASAAGINPRARAAASGCSDIPKGVKKDDSFTSKDSDGTQAKVTSTVGSEGAQLVMELSGHGYSVRVDLDFGACEPNAVEAPDCPTAGGELDGQIRYKLRIAVEVRKDGEEVWSQSFDVTRTTKLQGFTDTDAKLDFLDVRDVQTSNMRLGGSVRGFPPISIRTKIVRSTRVDMQSGAYEPNRSEIDVTVNAEGLEASDRAGAEDGIAEKSRADADKEFSEIVDKAMSGYRDRESNWQHPNACARLQFTPASDAIKAKRGGGGSFTATALASQGGGLSELDAKLSNQIYGTFSPTRAGGQQARFSYTVASQAPSNAKLSTTVHATSKAGVAEETWEQPIESSQINHIGGSFNGSQTQSTTAGPSSLTFTGSGEFDRSSPAPNGGAGGSFTLSTGEYTLTASGVDGSGVTGCQQSGSQRFTISPGNSSVFVQGGSPPYSYTFMIMPSSQTMTVTRSNCPKGAEQWEGTTFQAGLFSPIETKEPHTSQDGTDYTDSEDQNSGGFDFTENWSFRGTP